MELQSFSKIAERYKVIFFDAYGVLKNSDGVLEGVPEMVAAIEKRGADCYVITNDASRSPEEMSKAYIHPQYGSLLSAERNISSGMLAQEFLTSKVREGNVAYLGKPGSAYYIESAGLKAIPISEVYEEESIRAFVLMDDEGFDWFHDINRALNILRRLNIPVIVANTDLAYPTKSGEVAVAVGSIANMMEKILKKTFIRFGKPDTQIFGFAYNLALARNPALGKGDILMVGDTLGTDILGANKFGIDTALVLSGNTQRSRAEVHISASGIIPTYICESILT